MCVCTYVCMVVSWCECMYVWGWLHLLCEGLRCGNHAWLKRTKYILVTSLSHTSSLSLHLGHSDTHTHTHIYRNPWGSLVWISFLMSKEGEWRHLVENEWYSSNAAQHYVNIFLMEEECFKCYELNCRAKYRLFFPFKFCTSVQISIHLSIAIWCFVTVNRFSKTLFQFIINSLWPGTCRQRAVSHFPAEWIFFQQKVWIARSNILNPNALSCYVLGSSPEVTILEALFW